MKLSLEKLQYFSKSEKNSLFKIIVWVFMFGSVFYLGYKLFTFNGYSSLLDEWKSLPPKHFYWLGLVFLLMPLNWLSESIKWKLIVSETQPLSLKNAVKSVLAGFSTGFFTPNRMGDMVGRLVFLESSNRKTGVTLSLMSSLTQNIIIALCGIPGAILFFTFQQSEVLKLNNYLIITSIIAVVMIVLFLLVPKLAGRNKNAAVNEYIKGFANYSLSKSFLILFVSLIRFVIFSIQFYAMLRFFGVHLLPGQAIAAIPANYLFVTFTPSLAFTEPAIRGSYAVFFIGQFSSHTVGIALAGIGLWVINYLISMFLGFIVLLKQTKKEK
ncbi:MAG TPA: lysylphosphatidylglycerol synthase domain-containing protein [Paludibacter sp.]|nr:lysylphosphatidylglycerol synthase domain-containing protein [Paludibacter sp.]